MASRDEPTGTLSPVKQALLALKELQAQLDRARQATREPIAIIGAGCRLPGGVTGVDGFWRLLASGVDAIREVPPDRWDAAAFYDPDPEAPGKMNTRWGGFLDRIDGFDAAFFEISPREASAMDPQQRLLLEVCWEALEHAGQNIQHLSGGRVGVFAGASAVDYAQALFRDPEAIDVYHLTGSTLNALSGRVSFLLGVHGPSVVVDAACSSSLVALHLACQSLRLGECDLALAGGVNLVFSPANTVAMARTGMMAPDGRCKTFDASADGFVRGEGCAMVVLKRLSDARADGDRVLALVRGSAVGHDGRGASFAAPNPAAQKLVIRDALAHAEVAPERVSYVETHGTGTALGDPIEIEALTAVYGGERAAKGLPPLLLGSVKTNLGHLEAASGVTGLLKVVLAMQHREIPPHLHLRALSPHLDLAAIPADVPRARVPWAADGPRLAGVSSFGLSGSNAHVVLEEAPPVAEPEPARAADDYLLVISARSRQALADLVAAYRAQLAQGAAALGDVCHTASVRRAHHAHRVAVVARTPAQMAEKLAGALGDDPDRGVFTGQRSEARDAGLVFVFAGQGATWHEVAHDLLEQPAFRETIVRCDELLRAHAGWSLLERLQRPGGPRGGSEHTQPAFFAVQVALSRLLESVGIVPDAIVGQSLGEVAAAHVAGALSLPDAVRVVAQRGRITQAYSGQGRMALVALGEAETTRRLAAYRDRVWCSVLSSPATTVVSGEARAVEALVAGFAAEGVFSRIVDMPYASHCPYMAPAAGALEEALAGLPARAPERTLVSSVSGELVTAAIHDAAYWGRNLRAPVRLGAAIDACIGAGHRVFVELAPHPSLARTIKECLDARGVAGAAVSTLDRNQSGRQGLLGALAGLYVHGHAADWSKVYPRGRVVDLPAYPWQRKRYWLGADLGTSWLRGRAASDRSARALLGARLPELAHLPGHRAWQLTVDAGALGYLRDHRILDLPLVPASAYVEMALGAAAEGLAAEDAALADIEIAHAMAVPEAGARLVQIARSPGPGGAIVEIRSRPDQAGDRPWTLHARARVEQTGAPPPATVDLEALAARLPVAADVRAIYARLHARGLQFGPSFQVLRGLRHGDAEALGEIELAQAAGTGEGYALHPALLDGCFQVILATLPEYGPEHGEGAGADGAAYLPLGIERVRVRGRAGRRVWCHARARERAGSGAELLCVDYALLDDRGACVAEITGLRLKRTARVVLERALAELAPARGGDWLYRIEWQAAPSPSPAAAAPAGAWLILADGRGVGDALAEALAARGQQAIRVRPGTGMTRIGAAEYEVDLTRGDCVAALVAELGAAPAPAGVVHLRGLDAQAGDEVSTEALAADQRLAAASVLHLVRALARQRRARLWLVTRGAQPVPGAQATPLAVSQAPLWGLGRVIAREQPDLWGGLVDLDPRGAAAEQARWLADELIAARAAHARPGAVPEAAHGDVQDDVHDDQVALRDGQRRVARLGRCSSWTPDPARWALRGDASYLVTGGLGGLGLAVARAMVERGARYLVLAGRGAPSAAARAELDALGALGAHVHAERCDVARADDVRALLANLARSLPPLGGVVHAAGVLDDGALTEQTWERFERVLAPKVAGSWNLHRATLGLPLDFFVMFASASSFLGVPGQSNYAAANAFQDALAHERRRLGLPALSVHWGAWRDVGMAARRGVVERVLARGMGSMSPAEGVAVLAGLADAPWPHVAVLPEVDWPTFVDGLAQGRAPRYFAELVREGRARGRAAEAPVSQAAAGASLAARLAEVSPAERRALLAEHLRELLIKVLGLDRAEPVPTDRGFTDLGMDSLTALEIKNRLQASLGRPLPATLAFEHPTIATLAEHLLARVLGLGEPPPARAAAPPVPPAIPDEGGDMLRGVLSELDDLSDDDAISALVAARRGAKQ